MKIQLDSIKFCREIRAALKDDRTAVKWLRSFYETNGFHFFGHRTSETDGETYGQMFAFVRQKKDAG